MNTKLNVQDNNIARRKIKDYIFLHISLFFYSLATVFTKLASNYKFLSLKFIAFYGVSIFILFIYAILWQQNLKRISLTTAFANKAIVVVWGIVWGILIFKEEVTLGMIIGCFIIFLGIERVISDDK